MRTISDEILDEWNERKDHLYDTLKQLSEHFKWIDKNIFSLKGVRQGDLTVVSHSYAASSKGQETLYTPVLHCECMKCGQIIQLTKKEFDEGNHIDCGCSEQGDT